MIIIAFKGNRIFDKIIAIYTPQKQGSVLLIHTFILIYHQNYNIHSLKHFIIPSLNTPQTQGSVSTYHAHFLNNAVYHDTKTFTFSIHQQTTILSAYHIKKQSPSPLKDQYRQPPKSALS